MVGASAYPSVVNICKSRAENIRLYGREGGGTVAEVILPRSLHPVKLVEKDEK